MITLDEMDQTGPLTWSHSADGSNRCLIVSVKRDATARVTFHNIPMTDTTVLPQRRRWDQFGAYHRRYLKKWLRKNQFVSYILDVSNVDPANPVGTLSPPE